MRGFILACVIATSAMAVPEAAAQTERMLVSGSIAGALGTGGPAPAMGVAAGFRLATHAGFEAELSFIPSQDFRGGAGSAVLLTFPGTPAPQFAEKGRTILFLPSVVTDVSVGRLRPYAQFGAGMANVRRNTILSAGTAGGSITTTRGVTGGPVSTERTANDLALGAGAGLDVRVWTHLSIAADVRYVHLVGDSSTGEKLDITRIGTRVNYRF